MTSHYNINLVVLKSITLYRKIKEEGGKKSSLHDRLLHDRLHEYMYIPCY